MLCGVSVVTFHEPPHSGMAQGLLAQDVGLRTRVLVNEATDEEIDAVARAVEILPGASVTAELRNTGFSGGHNRNCEVLFAEGCEYVLVLNPDVRLAPGALKALLKVSRERDDWCLVGPLLELGEGPDLSSTGLVDSAGIVWTRSARHLDALQGEPLSSAPVANIEREGLTGACLLVPRRAWEALRVQTGELFDEDFVAYREDAELGLRARALRLPLILAPSSRAVHGRQLRGTSRAVSPLVNRLGVQNRFLILAKHGRRRPGSLLLAGGRDALVVLGVLLREHSSIAGLANALRLWGRMRRKRRQIYGLPS